MMDQLGRLSYLVGFLLEERGEGQPLPSDVAGQRRLLRALMNMRPPLPLDKEFLEVQDAFLQEELRGRGIVGLSELGQTTGDGLTLWQGDITRIEVDAIVNAANNRLLGCFIPGHHCIDNAIHSFSGLQLRDACNTIMQAQGYPEPTGKAKITPAFNLPSSYVVHTVGPIVADRVQAGDREMLASCYRSCLELAQAKGLDSIAFCCISTGEFRFPHQEAAQIALATVREDRLDRPRPIKAVFNVFTDEDYAIYKELMFG